MENPKTAIDLIIAAATVRELPFLETTDGAASLCREKTVHGLRLLLVATGPGPVNAAYSLGRASAIYHSPIILGTGIGGAYAESGLAPGDLAVATVEWDADTGVEPPTPEMPPASLSIPVSLGAHGSYPTDERLTGLLLCAAESAGTSARGPFVTSATVTSSTERAANLRNRYGAVCENMEGAAFARAAELAGAAFVEVRGISNLVGPRDLSAWKVAEAIAAYLSAVDRFVRALSKEMP